MPGLIAKVLEASNPQLLEISIQNFLNSEAIKGIKPQEHLTILGMSHSVAYPPTQAIPLYSCVIIYELVKP